MRGAQRIYAGGENVPPSVSQWLVETVGKKMLDMSEGGR